MTEESKPKRKPPIAAERVVNMICPRLVFALDIISPFVKRLIPARIS
jgi:hypothetical protein